MKLYVESKSNNINTSSKRIYLDVVTKTRHELAKAIGSEWFILNNQQFHISDVFAEASSMNNTASSAVIGGLVGTLGGPFGIFLGSLIGGAIGNSSDEDEKEKVALFNNSLAS